MSKKYTSDEILKMAVNLAEKDMAADLDSDGKITSADARLADNTDTQTQQSDEKPQGYDDPFASVTEDVLDKLLTVDDADAGIDTQNIYNRYKDMYSENAENASENVYGLATGSTGGYGNTYAATLAGQAYKEYMSGLDDKLLDINEQALDTRESEYNYLLKLLNSVSDLSENDYSHYRDEVGDYYKDEQLLADERKSTAEFAFDAAEQGDYSFLAAMGVDVSGLQRDADFDEAVKKAKYGDYSALRELGVNTDAVVYSQLLDIAVILAEQGDYSALEALGVDMQRLRADDLLEKAVALAKQGDTSLLGTFKSNYNRIINSGR